MATVTLYSFEDSEGREDTYTTFDASEAKDRGRRYGLLVTANEYEWSDSETAWDFRERADASLEAP